MAKAFITAHDALALLEKNKLYPNQLHDILNEELKAKKILCLSDTTDVLLKDHETASVAHAIEKAGLGAQIEIIQSDFVDFSYLSPDEAKRKNAPKFGAHLPQQEFESRREYAKINSTQLKEDISQQHGIDVILGRNCICACSGDEKLCGGIGISIEEQQNYLKILMEQGPNLIVLSANSRRFTDDMSGQLLYIEAKKNMIQALSNLNALPENPYRFELFESEPNRALSSHPEYENGYTIVAYDTRKIDLHPSLDSPQRKRQQEKIESRLDASATALTDGKKRELAKLPTNKDMPSINSLEKKF